MKNPVLFKSDELSPHDKEYLNEHYMAPRSFHDAHSSEGFIIDETGQILITLNIVDHIQIQLTDISGDLESTWNKLAKIENNLGSKMTYTFTPRFGFLTANPAECGTGLCATVYLHTPALIHTEKLKELLENNHDDSINVTGLQGKPQELIGDIVAIHNNYSLGIAEENIISTLRTFATRLASEEKTARKALVNNTVIKDKVSRAYGVLVHSYQIGTIEALNAISLIKLGTELGWIDGITLKNLNKMLFSCRRAHFLNQFSQDIPVDEIPHKRAEFIHQHLKDTHLHI